MALEDLEIPGFVLFLVCILALFLRALQRGLATRGVLLTALLINMEVFLFSPGGIGMLIFSLLSWAAAKPQAPTSIGNLF